MLLIIIWYFFHNYFWRRLRSRPYSPGLGIGLGLEVLASFNITGFAVNKTHTLSFPSAVKGAHKLSHRLKLNQKKTSSFACSKLITLTLTQLFYTMLS